LNLFTVGENGFSCILLRKAFKKGWLLRRTVQIRFTTIEDTLSGGDGHPGKSAERPLRKECRGTEQERFKW